MRSFIAAAIVGYASAMLDSNDFEFMKYIAHHNKSYATAEEYAFRLKQWMRVDAYVKEVNAPGSIHTHTATHNKFSDWTQAEFDKLMGLKNSPLKNAKAEPYKPKKLTYASSFDWRTRTPNCVTPVKDQGQCGSCWAFSATESVESAQCVAGNGLLELSPQQLVDCSTSYGNNGCGGGWYYYAWDYLKVAGQELNSAYPYTAKDGTCKYNSANGKAQVTSYTNVSGTATNLTGRMNAMKTAIGTAPLSVAIQANQLAFQSYSSGVITSGCGVLLDHAVAAEGYNDDASTPYWIVRNSWGASWGQSGYVYIGQGTTARGYSICGVASTAYSVLTKDWVA